jgi:hypothetical protein
MAKRKGTLDGWVIPAAKRPTNDPPIERVVAASSLECRLTSDGYVQALMKAHAKDERYTGLFLRNTAEDIARTLRGCFTPAVAALFRDRKEADLAS